VTVRQITLSEWGSSKGVVLALEERDFLMRMTDKLTIQPVGGAPSTYVLSACSWVGALNHGDLAVHILPKIGIPRLMFLISYALDPRHWRDIETAVASDPTVFEAVVPSFLLLVRRATTRGLLQGYRIEEEALATVRGRIRFDEQIRRRHGILPPIEVRFDEFTEDIEENRLLLAAVARLRCLPLRSSQSSRSLRRLERALQTVSRVSYARGAVPQIIFTRLNGRYRSAIELARLILEASSLELRHEEVVGSAFLVDMNVVFEEFVRTALREALALTPAAFPAASVGHPMFIDRDRRLRLEPDLTWWEGSQCRFVGDAKYKRTSGAGGHNPDVYQLLAYLLATELSSGMLIYAAGEEQPVIHAIPSAEKEIEVVALNLDQPPDHILSDICVLADRIRKASARPPHQIYAIA
jgi:5-methylcytosine-specific restriction enzyme subunit McrC